MTMSSIAIGELNLSPTEVSGYIFLVKTIVPFISLHTHRTTAIVHEWLSWRTLNGLAVQAHICKEETEW